MNTNWTKKTLRPSIFVSVTKALSGDTDEDFKGVPLEDIARGFWSVGDKANRCELLWAVSENTIVGVWEIDRDFGWKNMYDKCIPTRKPVKIDPAKKFCKVFADKKIPEQALVGHRLTEIEGMTPLAFPFKYSFI